MNLEQTVAHSLVNECGLEFTPQEVTDCLDAYPILRFVNLDTAISVAMHDDGLSSEACQLLSSIGEFNAGLA